MYDTSYVLIHMVLPEGKASKALKFARKHGVSGGTIKLCRGTVSNKLLNFLSIYNDSRELLIMGCDIDTAKLAIPLLVEEFDLHKSNKGILFATEIETVYDTDGKHDSQKLLGDDMYKLITVVVEKGKAEEVVDTANSAGARGGTIFHARGAGTRETRIVFNIEIEPEKEVLMIVVKTEDYKNIIEQIDSKHKICKPGNGIIFVQDIVEAHGLFED